MRCLLVVVLALSLCAPASAQAPPADLWESAPAVGGSPGTSGRDAALFVLALVVFAGAGGTAVLALRTPRRPRAPRAPRPVAAPVAEPAVEPPVWHPRVSGPPPLPAFGPGSHAGPSAAPPPPD